MSLHWISVEKRTKFSNTSAYKATHNTVARYTEELVTVDRPRCSKAQTLVGPKFQTCQFGSKHLDVAAASPLTASLNLCSSLNT